MQEKSVRQGLLHSVPWPLLAGVQLFWGLGGVWGMFWGQQGQDHGKQQHRALVIADGLGWSSGALVVTGRGRGSCGAGRGLVCASPVLSMWLLGREGAG